jgi:hypothetical protein
VFLSNGRILGFTREVQSRQRLIDVLGSAAPSFTLTSAKAPLGPSGTQDFETLNIEKRAIVVAIPHETKLQQRERSVLTTTVGKSETHPIKATLVLPPFIAEGSVHVPSSFGRIGNRLTADPQMLGRFVSVTDARLTLLGGDELEALVLLVNRDLIAAISVPEERRTAAPALEVPAPARVATFAHRREGD